MRKFVSRALRSLSRGADGKAKTSRGRPRKAARQKPTADGLEHSVESLEESLQRLEEELAGRLDGGLVSRLEDELVGAVDAPPVKRSPGTTVPSNADSGEATVSAPARAMTPERRKLIRQALDVQRSQQKLLDGLSREERARLQAIAMKALFDRKRDAEPE